MNYSFNRIMPKYVDDAFYEDWETSGEDEMEKLYQQVRAMNALNDEMERWLRNTRDIKRTCESCR
jgi:hypothetical protein